MNSTYLEIMSWILRSDGTRDTNWEKKAKEETSENINIQREGKKEV